MGVFIKVKPDYSRDSGISPIGKQLISEYYLQQGETSPQDAFARAANCWSFGDSGLAQRLYDYVSRQWFGFASPVLSNAIDIDWPSTDFKTNSDWLKEWIKGNPIKAQPISCFLSYMADTREGIVGTWAETAWLTYAGGGIGIHAKLRSNEGKSTGVISNLHVTDAQMLACKQGDVRRGSAAVYLDISHPEFKEYLHMRRIGGDPKRKNFNLHNAVCIPNTFMKAVVNNEMWTFVDPASNIEYDKISARELWREILQVRSETGEPYLFFTDTANKALNQAQKDLGLIVHGSNLCNEIFLPTNEERTAVCCLSSPNIEKYDEWKDTNMIKDIVRTLDNVLEFFICTAPEGMKKAVFSATKERSIGVGIMGFHSYLQSKGVPFESGGFNSAAQFNYEVFKKIKNDCYEESEQLGKERGFPDDCIALKRRNANLIAIAPTANNSLIVGTSPSVEPWNSNCFVQNTRAGDFVIKNKHLQSLFNEKGFDEAQQEKLWNQIVQDDGSVQKIKELSKQEKDVFKTAFEIKQDWIIEHASVRQQFICQGQSINLFFLSGADKSYVERVHFDAWRKGLKGLYYFRTKSKVNAEKVQNKVEREALVDGTTINSATCLSCEG